MFNFIIDCSDSELPDYLNMAPEDAVRVFTRGDLNWCLQTYLILRRENKLPVACSNKLCDDAINIIHSDQLLRLKGIPSQFIVCVRADYPKRRWAHYHIVQNKRQLEENTSYVPHWVQPGLIKRDENRQGVSRVAYAGEIQNGNLAGSIEAWTSLLEPHGIEFVALQGGEWHNLRDIDVLIGIRSFSSQTYDTKPPTKLFSGWHANIPFVGGNDSAFMQVAKPGEDYLLAKTPQEAVSAVLKLKNDKELYTKLVQRGREKVLEYNERTIAQEWHNILIGPVTQRFDEWKRQEEYEHRQFVLKQRIGITEHEIKRAIKSFIKAY